METRFCNRKEFLLSLTSSHTLDPDPTTKLINIHPFRGIAQFLEITTWSSSRPRKSNEHSPNKDISTARLRNASEFCGYFSRAGSAFLFVQSYRAEFQARRQVRGRASFASPAGSVESSRPRSLHVQLLEFFC